MDQGRFQTLKQYLGIKLITYCIDANTELDDSKSLQNLNLNQKQLEALDQLELQIRQLRHSFITNGGYGNNLESIFAISNFDSSTFFNTIRSNCGGQISKFSFPNDPILQFLADHCSIQYPNLLLKQVDNNSFRRHLSIKFSECEHFASLVRQDVLHALTNKASELDYAFKFRTDLGIEIHQQVVLLPPTLIERVFQTCCSRMKYDLNSIIFELESTLNSLRQLASGEKITIPCFVGFRGVALDGSSELAFDKFYIRQIDSFNNPGTHILNTGSLHNDGSNQILTGTIVEVPISLKIIPIESTQPINIASSSKIHLHLDIVINAFKMAVILHFRREKGIVASFSEVAFPLTQVGNFAFNNLPIREIYRISSLDSIEIKQWFSLLLSKDAYEHVSVPLRRLNFSVHDRTSVEDSLVDAFIAWEAMFSEPGETTFKVAGAMTKFLFEPRLREIKFQEIKKLYSLRSKLVHGSKNGPDLNAENSYVIGLAIDALKKLLSSPDLLKKKPAERVAALLVTYDS